MSCNKTRGLFLGLLVLGASGWFAQPALAADVSPMMGGGQSSGSMKHADVSFVGNNIGVTVDATVATPWLLPLTGTNTFSASQPWSVLSGKAYNYQYAWNPSGFYAPPAGAGIWIERESATPGLLAYMRPNQWTSAMGPTWTQILANDGDRWQWAGGMQHNAYAVLNPTLSVYTATYKVYIGDAITGAPLAGYGSALATFTWDATPVVPEPASLALLGLGAIALVMLRQRKQQVRPVLVQGSRSR